MATILAEPRPVADEGRLARPGLATRPRPGPGSPRGRRPAPTRRVPAATATSGRRWLALVLLLVAAFMDLLDTSIVNVAIPSIRSELDAGYASLQWIVAGYLLAVAVGLITFARLGDRYGRRRLFLIGVVGFGLSSLSCGLAPTSAVLIVARVLQGLFAAAMIPQILSTIHVSFAPAEKPRALALYSMIAGLAVMSGPLVGGVLLSELSLSWRYIFLINVPVAIAVTVGTIIIVPESRSDDAQRPDFVGAALISAALLALVFSLIQGREAGWPAWIFGLIGLSVMLFAAFAWYERRKERRRESPLIMMRLFRRRAVSVGLLVVLVLYSGIVGFWLSFAIYLQIGLGYTPIHAALTTLPSSIGLILASVLSTKLVQRPGRALLACGAAVMAVSMAGLIAVFSHDGGGVTAWELRPMIFVFGIGMGLTIPPLADAIIAHIPERVAGSASGLINTGLQVGNAIGVAVIGVILFSVLSSHAPSSARSEATTLTTQLAAQHVPAAERQQIVTDFSTCFVDASRQKDPAAVPASCHKAAAQHSDPAMAKAFTGALEQARKDNFSVAIAHAVAYALVAFLAAGALLMFLNPNAARRRYGYTARHASRRGPPVLAA